MGISLSDLLSLINTGIIHMQTTRLLLATLMMISLPVLATEKTVTVHSISEAGVGKTIGTIKLADSAQGLSVTPKLTGLPAGERGFHIHENPSCETLEKDGKRVAGRGAGGHADPTHGGKHEGPRGAGHSGDLPSLLVPADGSAREAFVAPSLRIVDFTH